MAQVSLAHCYPELFRVTGPLQSFVLRTEDMWQRYNQCIEADGALRLKSGIPLLTVTPFKWDFGVGTPECVLSVQLENKCVLSV